LNPTNLGKSRRWIANGMRNHRETVVSQSHFLREISKIYSHDFRFFRELDFSLFLGFDEKLLFIIFFDMKFATDWILYRKSLGAIIFFCILYSPKYFFKTFFTLSLKTQHKKTSIPIIYIKLRTHFLNSWFWNVSFWITSSKAKNPRNQKLYSDFFELFFLSKPERKLLESKIESKLPLTILKLDSKLTISVDFSQKISSEKSIWKLKFSARAWKKFNWKISLCQNFDQILGLPVERPWLIHHLIFCVNF
jgi:hypothetical protein